MDSDPSSSAGGPAAWMLPVWMVRGAALALIALLFAVDAHTSADNVSLCFAYAIPIFLGLFDRRGAAFAYAALATVLSVAGSFVQPPSDQILATFIANRVIAIITQWLVALLVHYRQRSDALLRARLDLEQRALARQRRFLAILSHEVNTPLTTIDGQAYRLGKLRQEVTPDGIAERTGKIRAAVGRIGEMVRKIELASRVAEGDIPVDPQPFDLRALVAEAAEQAAEEAGPRPLVLDIAALPAHWHGDPALLRQVLDNLLSNAAKFSAAGSELTVRGTREGEGVMIEVADRGVGIAEPDRAMLFKPYFRGENSKGVRGAGIGLYLARQLVEILGGSIAAEPRPGGGTSLRIQLPARAAGPGGGP